MDRFLPTLGVLLATLCSARPAVGQQQYELTERDEWRIVESVDPDTPAGELADAKRALAGGEAKRAYRLAKTWIDRHEHDPLLAEAYVVRGDAQKAMGNYYKALFDYEFVARSYPAAEAFVTVLQRELEIGILYARGTKRKWLGMRVLDAGDIAEELLIRVQERMPGSHLAEQAAIELADYYFRRQEMRLAVEMYTIFLENHPDSAQVSKARRRLIYSNLATFKGPAFDASGLREAKSKLEEFIVLEPAAAERIGAEALISRVNESEASKLLLTARWYLKTGDPIAAELLIRRLMTRFPRTVTATEALKVMDKVLPRLPIEVIREAPDYRTLQATMLGREMPKAPPDVIEVPSEEQDDAEFRSPEPGGSS